MDGFVDWLTALPIFPALCVAFYFFTHKKLYGHYPPRDAQSHAASRKFNKRK
jgi:hypothetical protein